MLSMFIDQLGPIMLSFSSAFHVVDISNHRVLNGTVGPVFIFLLGFKLLNRYYFLVFLPISFTNIFVFAEICSK